jgi:hypothetical protein
MQHHCVYVIGSRASPSGRCDRFRGRRPSRRRPPSPRLTGAKAHLILPPRVLQDGGDDQALHVAQKDGPLSRAALFQRSARHGTASCGPCRAVGEPKPRQLSGTRQAARRGGAGPSDGLPESRGARRGGDPHPNAARRRGALRASIRGRLSAHRTLAPGMRRLWRRQLPSAQRGLAARGGCTAGDRGSAPRALRSVQRMIAPSSDDS